MYLIVNLLLQCQKTVCLVICNLGASSNSQLIQTQINWEDVLDVFASSVNSEPNSGSPLAQVYQLMWVGAFVQLIDPM